MNLPDYSLSADRVPVYEPKNLAPSERDALVEEIATLLKARDAVLVAHYYVDGDVQDLAETTGGVVSDSLEMARFGNQHLREHYAHAGAGTCPHSSTTGGHNKTKQISTHGTLEPHELY